MIVGGVEYEFEKFSFGVIVFDVCYNYFDSMSLYLDNFSVVGVYKLMLVLFVLVVYLYMYGSYGGVVLNLYWN